MNAPHPVSAYIIVDRNDLAALWDHLGQAHPLTQRVEDALSDLNQSRTARYRHAAQQHAGEGDLEVDDNAIVSMSGDGGAYVMAWLWINDEEILP